MAAAIVGSAAASVQVFDDELGGLRLLAWRGFHPVSAAFWDVVVPESASTCGMALVTGERVVVPDLEAEEALAGSEDLHEYRRSGLRAVQSTPLVADGRVIGMLSMHWRTPHEPSAAEWSWIDSLGRGCALALARGRERPLPERAPRTQPLHEVNKRIREMAARFESTAGDDLPQTYICECGCGSSFALTDREFDAMLAALRPITVKGHWIAT
jgi:GAF domain-containing protein